MPKPIEKYKIKVIVITAIILFIVGYTLFRMKDLMLGPSLTISNPANGASVKDSYLEVSGFTQRIAKIYLNGRQIFTDDKGYFHEPLLLSYGYNIISVNAEDRFGRIVDKKIELVLK